MKTFHIVLLPGDGVGPDLGSTGGDVDMRGVVPVARCHRSQVVLVVGPEQGLGRARHAHASARCMALSGAQSEVPHW